jgi:hypothetical protein
VSYTQGPCPKCGEIAMYEDRDPTPCNSCRDPQWVQAPRPQSAGPTGPSMMDAKPKGNRKQRLAAKAKAKKK